MPHPIINLDALDYVRWNTRYPPDQQPPLDRFGADNAQVGAKIGARRLGYNVTAIDPGKAAYPAHNHRVNEEMFLVLEGEGELRLGADRFPVRQGDIIACPPGGPETAHQLRNTGSAPLKVLMVSTMQEADVLQYPDSGKTAYGVMATGPDGKPQLFRGLSKDGSQPGYWEGE
jgi:uncharacterized cupin superfamily protein